jgi:outer membrane protein OmpA-like peptidoglycan-associated protein
VAYAEALKHAGWTLVEENTELTTGDPYLTAHYVKGTVDLWAHVHSRGSEGYSRALADAGAERGAAKMKAQIDKSCKVPVYGLNFDFDKATLRADSEAALNAILAFLNAYPDLAVELAGHTDNVGKPDYNAKLSEARVNTVRGWLVGKGVKPERLTAKGYGDAQPVATNDAPEGRAKNRRVELRKRGCAQQQ